MKNIIFILSLIFCIRAAALPVAIPEKANDVERYAAKELSLYLELVTKKPHPVVTENKLATDAKGYFLGRTNRAQEQQIVPPQVDNAFVIEYKNGNLFIVGIDGNGKESQDSNPAGTLFGVYHFLRHNAKIRWVYPGKDGETVPVNTAFTPSEKCNFRYIPKLADRGFGGRAPAPEIRRFFRRNMFLTRPSHPGRGGHSKFIYPQYGKSNPEFFALDNQGKRRNIPSGSLCLSNRKLQEALTRDAIDNNKLYISGHEADNVLRCNCQNCRAWDGEDFRGPTGRYAPYRNMGERYARYYRQLLETGKKAFPELRVSAYAYQSYFYAPRQTELDKDIHIGLVPDIPFPRTKKHTEFLRNEYTLWAKSGATLYLRPNYFNGGYCMPEVWFDEFAGELKFLTELNISGILSDGYFRQSWATRGLDQYIAARLIAEPDADISQLFSEYLSGFGAASPMVKEYFNFFQKYLKDNCEKINELHETSIRRWYFHGFIYAAYAHKIFPASVLKSQRAVLDKAAAAVAKDRTAAIKVAFLRAGLEHAAASSECAAIFASNVPSAKKTAAQKALYALREKLPRFAVDAAYCKSVENNSWKAANPLQLAGSILPLPELFKIRTDPEDKGEIAGFYKTDFDDSNWKEISSWRSLESSGIFNANHVFYRAQINIPESDSRRCILYLGAVDKDCKVWINGKLAGTSRYDAAADPDMWQLPRRFDLTDFVESGKNNLLCVKVSNPGGGQTGLWKPSFLLLENSASGKPVSPWFRIPFFAAKSKSGKYQVISVRAVKDPKRNKFLSLISNLKLDLAPGSRYRIRGEVRIKNIHNGRVDVSFRQSNDKAKKQKFDDATFSANTDSWEEFSIESKIITGMNAVKLYLICRNLGKDGVVDFRKITIEKL